PVGDGPVVRGSRPGSPRPLGATRASSARARTLQRRRQVLYTLAGAFVATLVLGAIPSLHLIWWVTGLSGIMLAAYVGILVHLRNLAAEREMKLRFLPARSIEPTMLLRRSAN
ncbi:MAG: hypothetical protein ACRDZY_18490, partial [Acidimicrobiales bacterium]